MTLVSFSTILRIGGHNSFNYYLKAKTEELETNSKIKNIRDLYRGTLGIKAYQANQKFFKSRLVTKYSKLK